MLMKPAAEVALRGPQGGQGKGCVWAGSSCQLSTHGMGVVTGLAHDTHSRPSWPFFKVKVSFCLLYTSDAADDWLVV